MTWEGVTIACLTTLLRWPRGDASPSAVRPAWLLCLSLIEISQPHVPTVQSFSADVCLQSLCPLLSSVTLPGTCLPPLPATTTLPLSAVRPLPLVLQPPQIPCPMSPASASAPVQATASIPAQSSREPRKAAGIAMTLPSLSSYVPPRPPLNPQLTFLQDVDFATSFLCGYLCIRGLTDDWPELTTYFDAEIIGSRYGFLTQNWGASENEDIVHWSRFPAFRNIRHEAKRPRLTIDDRDRGAVFMRWKEKFLVPDHRVHDISGASFAGHLHLFFPKIVLLNNPSRVLLCLRRLQPLSVSPCPRLKR